MTDLDFADRLTNSLDALAGTVTVHQPDPVSFRRRSSFGAPTPSIPSRSRGRMLLIAACLAAVMAGGGFAALVATRGAPTSVGQLSDLGADPSENTGDVEIIMWLDVDTTPDDVAALTAALEVDTRLTSAEYIDRDATYEEFLRFYADEPELTALVEPEQLPTSFRVLVPTAAAGEFLRWAARQPSVVDVERADAPDAEILATDDDRALLEAEVDARRDVVARLMAEQMALQTHLEELEARRDESGEIAPGLGAQIRETNESLNETTTRLEYVTTEIKEIERRLRDASD